MRKFRQRIKGIAAVAAAFACAFFAYALIRSPVFAGNEYEFSLGSSSSARIVRTDAPALFKFFTDAAGESARFAGDVHEALFAQLRAQVLFTEEACGVTAYYCYSPLLGEGVLLGGRRVNLQVAVGNGRTAAGTPLIFGGF